MSKLVLSLECTSGPIDLTPSIRFERQANHEACPGGETKPGLIGGWQCSCDCHRVPSSSEGNQ